jgi:hypothetical protein
MPSVLAEKVHIMTVCGDIGKRDIGGQPVNCIKTSKRHEVDTCETAVVHASKHLCRRVGGDIRT